MIACRARASPLQSAKSFHPLPEITMEIVCGVVGKESPMGCTVESRILSDWSFRLQQQRRCKAAVWKSCVRGCGVSDVGFEIQTLISMRLSFPRCELICLQMQTPLPETALSPKSCQPSSSPSHHDRIIHSPGTYRDAIQICSARPYESSNQ